MLSWRNCFNGSNKDNYESICSKLNPIVIAVALFVVGTAFVIKGGDVFVDAAGWISEATGISGVVIGATLVSFATTAPEYFVSLIAAIKGHADLSVGNAVGSLSANLGIAFALLAVFTPGTVKDRLFGAKGLIMIVSTALLLLFCLSGAISVIEGAALLLMFAIATFVNIRYAKDDEKTGERKRVAPREALIPAAKFIGGAAAIIFGSNLIVDNAQVIASALGMSEAVIGLTIVAVGTSLPEIVTSVAAIIKKQNAISIGNIIGANIMDATLILATGSFITGGKMMVLRSAYVMDIPLALVLMIAAVLPSAVGKKIYRWQGALMAGIYIAYIVYRISAT